MKKILVILMMLISLTSFSQSTKFGTIKYINTLSSERNFFTSLDNLFLYDIKKKENFAYCQEDFLGEKECNLDSLIGTYKILNTIDTSINARNYHILILNKNNNILYYNINKDSHLRFSNYNDLIKKYYLIEPILNNKSEIIISTTNSYINSDTYKLIVSRNLQSTIYFSRTYKNGKLISETITQY